MILNTTKQKRNQEENKYICMGDSILALGVSESWWFLTLVVLGTLSKSPPDLLLCPRGSSQASWSGTQAGEFVIKKNISFDSPHLQRAQSKEGRAAFRHRRSRRWESR